LPDIRHQPTLAAVADGARAPNPANWRRCGSRLRLGGGAFDMSGAPAVRRRSRALSPCLSKATVPPAAGAMRRRPRGGPPARLHVVKSYLLR
jgi:hypothetical protein